MKTKTTKRGAPRKPGRIYHLPIRCADETYAKILAAHSIDRRAEILVRAIREKKS